MTNELDTDVLIVGAGPVGLFLANECARRDLRWLIVELSQGRSFAGYVGPNGCLNFTST